MANEKRFLVLSLKWWQKLQPKWRRGENLTLDRSTTMTFPNPASPTLCHKIYFTVIHLGWARRDCQTQLDTTSNHPTFETSKQQHPEKLLLAESCGIRNFIPNRRSDVQVHGCHLITLRKCVWWWNQSDEMHSMWTLRTQSDLKVHPSTE